MRQFKRTDDLQLAYFLDRITLHPDATVFCAGCGKLTNHKVEKIAGFNVVLCPYVPPGVVYGFPGKIRDED